MNILLVDDECIMLQILEKAINWTKLGIKDHYTARNAAEAKKVIQEEKIDIVLCDIEMPKESGLELIKWIQGIYPDIVNIILSGHADFNYARSAISLGVYSYLLKPISFEEVEQTIGDVVERAKGMMEEKDSKEEMGETGDEGGDGSLILRVKLFIEQHFNEIITRQDIESLVHMSHDHINRKFKKSTGYTLMEYIQYYRLHIARKLLRETTNTISEIALSVGYDSPAYFSKVFKKRSGITPNEYRNGERSG